MCQPVFLLSKQIAESGGKDMSEDVKRMGASPAKRVAVGKEAQGSGRMTFFYSTGIKERRSKADFAPTWCA